jgi:hypothetical protein
MLDAVPSTTAPGKVNTSLGLGIAQRVSSIGRVSLLMPTGAGVDWTGDNVGWAWSTGLGAAIPLPNHMFLMPNVRGVKSSVSNGQGMRFIYGMMWGWGKP